MMMSEDPVVDDLLKLIGGSRHCSFVQFDELYQLPNHEETENIDVTRSDLKICLRIPIAIVQNHCISTLEIDPNTTYSSMSPQKF